jgi:hypothetical protein
LQRDKSFVDLRATAFAPEIERRERLRAADQPRPDRPEAMVAPPAERAKALKNLASMAQNEFEKQWPEAGGGANAEPLALAPPPQSALAMDCWFLVTAFCGREGFDAINKRKTGKNAVFGNFVKAVANYSTGSTSESRTPYAYIAGIKYAIEWGIRYVERFEKQNKEDYFKHSRYDVLF